MSPSNSKWDEFIGQRESIELLRRMDKAGKKAHILLHGPPGTGKTTIAKIIGSDKMLQVIGSSLKTPEHVTTLVVTAAESGIDTLFIDEVHSAKLRALEILYPVMEEGLVYDEGMPRPAKIYIIASTTDGGRLPKPFVDRFGVEVRLRRYTENEIKKIIRNITKNYNLHLTPRMIEDVAKRSLGVPRTSRKIVERLADFHSEYRKWETYDEIISLTDIDPDGLRANERHVLRVMWYDFHRGPVGIKTLAFQTQMDEVLLTKYVEPTLIRLGYMTIEKSGRKLTARGVARAMELSQEG